MEKGRVVMKQKLIPMIMSVAALSATHMVCGFNPLSTSDWKRLGTKVVDWSENAYEKSKDKLKSIPECEPIVANAAEWAAKKAAYEIAVVAVDAAQEVVDAAKGLQSLDPRVTALRAELAELEAKKGALQTTQRAALDGINSVKGLATATDDLGTVGALIAQRNFELQRFELKTQLNELSHGKLPQFSVRAFLAGQSIDFNVQINVKDSPVTIAKDILVALAQVGAGLFR